MKYSTAVLAAAIVPSAYGHYFWNRLIVDGVETRDNEFVRRTTRPTAYNPIKWKNSRDNSTPDLDDIRCNQGAFSSAGSTGVKEVKAGSQVGFKLAVGATMQHPGPIIAYVSRAPGSVKEYRGDDDWIKIYEQGVCDTTKDFTKEAWCSWDKDRVNFPLPKELPDGEYLLRIEHIGLHGAHDGQAEFYPACAQIKVTGGSPAGGSLGEGIKLPGGYKPTDPSFAFSLWNGYKPYPMPGGPMFKGVTGGSGNANGGSSSSAAPTTLQTAAPTAAPTVAPSAAPSAAPTGAPSGPGNGTGSGDDYDNGNGNGNEGGSDNEDGNSSPGFPTPSGVPSAAPSVPIPSGAPIGQVPGGTRPTPTPVPAPGGPIPNCPNAPRRKHKRSRKAKKAAAAVEIQY